MKQALAGLESIKELHILNDKTISTYLLVWNPNRWRWKESDLVKDINEVNFGEGVTIRWSCGRAKKIKRGDRVFLIRLGKEPRGIFSSGFVVKGSFEAPHWDDKQAKQGKTSQFIVFRFDILLNPLKDMLLDREILISDPRFSKMHWDSQRSGIHIPNNIAFKLEKIWSETLIASFDWYCSPEEIDASESIYEGAKRFITINSYERNPRARKVCIDFHGARCAICGFDFEKTYGEIGKGFIHVHHLKSLTDIGKNYNVDPINDLRPVCPNCHAMIHKRKPAYTIDEVKKFYYQSYED